MQRLFEFYIIIFKIQFTKIGMFPFFAGFRRPWLQCHPPYTNKALSYSQFNCSCLQIHPSRMSFILVIVNSPLSLVGTLVSIPVGCRTPVSPALNVVILPYRVLWVGQTVACRGHYISPSLLFKLPLLTSDQQCSAPDPCSDSTAPHTDSYRREASIPLSACVNETASHCPQTDVLYL